MSGNQSSVKDNASDVIGLCLSLFNMSGQNELGGKNHVAATNVLLFCVKITFGDMCAVAALTNHFRT